MIERAREISSLAVHDRAPLIAEKEEVGRQQPQEIFPQRPELPNYLLEPEYVARVEAIEQDMKERFAQNRAKLSQGLYLVDLYWRQRLTWPAIAKQEGKPLSTLKKVVKRLGIESRTPSEVRLLYYEDPIRKADMLAKMQSPDAKSRRAASLRLRYQKDPEYRKTTDQKLKQMHKGNRLRARERKRILLGGNPAQRLRQMTNDGLTDRMIADAIGKRSPSTVGEWRRTDGVRIGIGRGAKIARKRPLVLKALDAGFLSNLSGREQAILDMRYLRSGKKATLQEVGDAIGISRERVRQIEKRSLQRFQIALFLK